MLQLGFPPVSPFECRMATFSHPTLVVCIFLPHQPSDDKKIKMKLFEKLTYVISSSPAAEKTTRAELERKASPFTYVGHC